jgi:hypothetical protein
MVRKHSFHIMTKSFRKSHQTAVHKSQFQNITLHRRKRQRRGARHGQPGFQKTRLLPTTRSGGNDRHDASRRYLAHCRRRAWHEDIHDRAGRDGCVRLLPWRGRAVAVPIRRRGPCIVDCRDGLAFVTIRCRLNELGRGDPDGGGARDGGSDGYGDGAIDEHGGPGRPGLVGGGGRGTPLAVIAVGGRRWVVS